MGVVAIKIKIMPTGLDVSLHELRGQVQQKLKEAGAIRIEGFEEQPIAFGLKALIVTFAWPEDKESEKAEKAIKEVDGVSQTDIIDYRRAFG